MKPINEAPIIKEPSEVFVWRITQSIDSYVDILGDAIIVYEKCTIIYLDWNVMAVVPIDLLIIKQ